MENSLLTQFGQIVGTPEYASPKQADTMTGEIGQVSDVYSLGVLLYELLVGAVPFDTPTLRNAGLAEMLRIIREDEAPPLARKLTSMGALNRQLELQLVGDAFLSPVRILCGHLSDESV